MDNKLLSLFKRYSSVLKQKIAEKYVAKSSISDSVAVTEKGTHVLDAVEKNASVEGTLANQISQINSNLEALTEVKKFELQGWHYGQSWGIAYKYGRMVYLYIFGYLDKTFSINTDYQLSNYPRDWMPIGQKFFSAPLSDYNPNGIHLSIFFDWDNECLCINSPYSELAQGCLIRFSLTFVCIE